MGTVVQPEDSNGTVKITMDEEVDKAKTKSYKHFELETCLEPSKVFKCGDHIRVIKMSRMEGRTGVVAQAAWHGMVKITLDVVDDEKGKTKSYKPSELEFCPESNTVFKCGDHVRVIKKSRMEGRRGIVAQPQWHGMVKITLDVDDEKGNTKSYKPCELEAVDKVDEAEGLDPGRQVSSATTPQWNGCIYDGDTDNQSEIDLEQDWSAESLEREQFRQGEEIRCSVSSHSVAEPVQEAMTSRLSISKVYLLHSVWMENVEHCRNSCQAINNATAHFAKTMAGVVRTETMAPEDEERPPRCQVLISHPSSGKRLAWDLSGSSLIAFDVIMVPMGVFDLPNNGFFDAMNWITLGFWSLDMIGSFFVGFVKDGTTVMDPWQVVKKYLGTWFLPDLIIVGADWMYNMAAASGSSGVGDVGRFARVMRSVRTLRLVRLLKLGRILRDIQDRIDSEYLAIVGDVAKLIFFVLFLGHLIACVWYAIGNAGRHGGADNWISAKQIDEEPLELRYVCALHWSLTQLMLESMDVEAQNIYERWFTIGTLNFGLLIFSSVVSRITNSMIQLQKMGANTTQQFWLLRRYCRERGVPKSLCQRVQKYLEYSCQKQEEHVQEGDVKILSLLSLQLREELTYAIAVPQLSTHLLFSTISQVSDVAMHRLSTFAIARRAFASEDSVFFNAEISSSMYFVSSGDLVYMRDNCDYTVNVGREAWLCEVSLWTPWVHLGDLHATTECDMVCIDAPKFGETMKNNPLTWAMATRYAEKFMAHLNGVLSHKLTDLEMSEKWDDLFEQLNFEEEEEEIVDVPVLKSQASSSGWNAPFVNLAKTRFSSVAPDASSFFGFGKAPSTGSSQVVPASEQSENQRPRPKAKKMVTIDSHRQSVNATYDDD